MVSSRRPGCVSCTHDRAPGTCSRQGGPWPVPWYVTLTPYGPSSLTRTSGPLTRCPLESGDKAGPSYLASGTTASYAGEMPLPLLADSPGLDFQPGDHICAFYNGGGNHLDDIVVDFVSKGLRSGKDDMLQFFTEEERGTFPRDTFRRTHSCAAWKPRPKERFPRDTNASG